MMTYFPFKSRYAETHKLLLTERQNYKLFMCKNTCWVMLLCLINKSKCHEDYWERGSIVTNVLDLNTKLG